MWDLPGPGLELVSPALAGGFLTTAPPGKPRREFLRGEFPHSAGAWGILQSPVSGVSRGATAKSSGSEQKELGLSSGLCPLTSCVNLGKRLKSLNLCFLSYKIRIWDLYSLSYCED